MYKIRNIFIVIQLFLALVVSAKDGEDHLSYDVPPSAEKLAPYRTGTGWMAVPYMSHGKEFVLKNMVAKDEFRDEKLAHLAQRNLYKDGILHGIQREWHDNGRLWRESPYKEGVMHGIFREWDLAGILVAQYEIKNGKGTRVVYNTSGRLVERTEVVDSNPNGFSLLVLSEVLAIGSRFHGVPANIECRFFLTGELESICFWGENGRFNGPWIKFLPDGSIKKIQWFVNSKGVTKSEYSDIIKQSHLLPPYFSDPKKYRALVDAETKRIAEEYLKLPLVKIPLELDKQGNPQLRK